MESAYIVRLYKKLPLLSREKIRRNGRKSDVIIYIRGHTPKQN